MGNISFLVIGILAGWMATMLVKGHGAGLLSNTLIGIVGAFVGGFIFTSFDITIYGFYGTLVMSFIGAVVFLLITGAMNKRSKRRYN